MTTGRPVRPASARPRFVVSPGAEFVNAFNEAAAENGVNVHTYSETDDYSYAPNDRFYRIKAGDIGFAAPDGTEPYGSHIIHINPRTGDTFVEALTHDDGYRTRDCTPEEQELVERLFAQWSLLGEPSSVVPADVC